MLSTPDAHKIRQWSEYYTSGPHLCGQNRSQAEWTRDLWAGFGTPKVDLATYELYLNYPRSHRLALRTGYDVTLEASLTEDVLPEDPTTGLPDRILTFHGYSANGSVAARYVFCNYDTYADFEELRAAGVVLAGNIALARYGRVFRGLKLQRASQLGMLAVVMYSDHGDDSDVTEGNEYCPYPHGPARNPSVLYRGHGSPGLGGLNDSSLRALSVCSHYFPRLHVHPRDTTQPDTSSPCQRERLGGGG